MQAAAAPLHVDVTGATYEWKVYSSKTFNGIFGRIRLRDEDQQTAEKFNEKIYDAAATRFRETFACLLAIPEENETELVAFFKENKNMAHECEMPIPDELSSFAPHLFQDLYSECDTISVKLNWGCVVMDKATKDAMRLVTVSADDQLQFDIKHKPLLQRCCAFVLVYLQRGFMPPQRLQSR
eukprot:2225863-Rhodomonas_salina.1